MRAAAYGGDNVGQGDRQILMSQGHALGATGGALPINNVFIDGDSDIQQGIVGRQLLVGILDSG